MLRVFYGAIVCSCALLGGGCGKKSDDVPKVAATDPAARDAGPGPNVAAAQSSAAASAAPSGKAPPDGKYEKVTVDGVTVPMVQVMNGGTVVLVDTDGQKPRTWEEQYKKKGNLPAGSFDVHKTDANKNDTFEDDPIDREGLWTIDEKGNITRR
jgi:hypothetical protein